MPEHSAYVSRWLSKNFPTSKGGALLYACLTEGELPSGERHICIGVSAKHEIEGGALFLGATMFFARQANSCRPCNYHINIYIRNNDIVMIERAGFFSPLVQLESAPEEAIIIEFREHLRRTMSRKPTQLEHTHPLLNLGLRCGSKLGEGLD